MIEGLRLENFRVFEQAEFSFGPVTVIVGNNGVGKTSILEAISMLSLTTSWKTEKDSEVVRWEAPFTRVTSGDRELVVQVHPYMKRMKIDGISKRATEVIGSFPTILFEPDDLSLLYAAPSQRRQYIDRTISQTSQAYTRAVLQMQQVLKQRNRLLKNIQEGMAGESELPFWDQQLAELQEVIQEERAAFLTFLQEKVPAVFDGMVPGGLDSQIHYLKSPHAAEQEFRHHLEKNRYKEIAAGVSLYGPHREDFSVTWAGHPVEQGMSRGQSRALMVAFKMAELDYIAERSEKRPVLLLDDIFSELDLERRHRLFSVLSGYQVIMTTTELGAVQEMIAGEVSVISLA